MTVKEDINEVIKSIMEIEKLPIEAAKAGAQRYALDCAEDLDLRAAHEYKNHRISEGNALSSLAKEYRDACFSL